MRTLKGQNLVHDQNYALFPEGAIQNETDQTEGTPVVREVYNDTLMNIYALLANRGININNQEDDEVNGYQILDALGLVFNKISDISNVFSKPGVDWLLNINLPIVPIGAILFVRVTDNMAAGTNAVFADNTGVLTGFTARTKLITGDDAVLIFDGNSSRIYSLNPLSIQQSNAESFVVFGNPISQNTTTDRIWYFKDGILSNMQLEFYQIESAIQNYFNTTDIIIKDVIQVKDNFLCLIYNTITFEYSNCMFENGDFNNVIPVTFNGFSPPVGPAEDMLIHMYCKGSDVYFSNQFGNVVEDYFVTKFILAGDELIYQQDIELASEFEKNQNTVFAETDFVYLNEEGFIYYNVNGVRTVRPTYNQLPGQIFRVGDNTYYGNGHNAFRIEL